MSCVEGKTVKKVVNKSFNNFESRQYTKVNTFLEKQFKSDDYLKDFQIGQRVKHRKFGVGTVSKILGEGKNKTVEIIFDDFGMKRLIIEYAKLENI